MKSFVIGITLILLLLTGGMPAAHAEETDRPPKPSEGRMKPPPEAIAACKGKSEGTVVQFRTSRGDTFKGVCKKFEGTLVAMPEHGPPPPRDKFPDEAGGRQPAD